MVEKPPANYARKRSSIRYTKKPVYGRKQAMRGENSWVETFIMQCIVSGIILACAMLLCVVKTPFTTKLRTDIKLAVGSNINGEESAEDILDFASNITNSVKSLFVKDEDKAKDAGAESDETVPVFYTNEQDFRIDEDILDGIYNNVPVSYDGDIKNWEAPQD